MLSPMGLPKAELKLNQLQQQSGQIQWRSISYIVTDHAFKIIWNLSNTLFNISGSPAVVLELYQVLRDG